MLRAMSAVALLAATALALLPEAASADDERERVAERVLVLALPTLRWDDLYDGRTPALDALLDESAVGAMSVRNVLPETDADDAYAAISAGARARGVPGSGQVLEPDESYFGTPAGAVFRRNTGVLVESGLVAFGAPELVRRNASLDFGAEIGGLGQALSDADVPRAAIANADGNSEGVLREGEFARTAATALIDERGVVPAGAVDGLLEADPAAPFGVRYSRDATVAAFEQSWAEGGVVLVEGSDLARADRYVPVVDAGRRGLFRERAIEATDALVADLLRSVDPTTDAVLVVAPHHSDGEVHLTVAALRAPGVQPGLLRSASTRRVGIVTLVDIAPTILDLVGVERPGAMEGRRFERAADGASTGAARAADLADLDAASRFRDHMVAPVAVAFVVLQAVLWIAATRAMHSQSARRRRAVSVAALALLAVLPATYLAAALPLHDGPVLAYVGFVAATATGIGGLAAIVGRRRPLDPLLLCLGVVFGLLAVDMLLAAPLQLNTVFGYSPTVGGRFAGMGNLAFGQFAGAAFLLCGLLARRSDGRAGGVLAGVGVLVVAVVIDGMPIWGSDVGGVLALVPAVGVTVATLLGRRVHWRSASIWGAAAVGVVGVFAALDLSRPADRRTHLGRLVESVADQGFGAFETVVTRKLGANLGFVASSIWTAMVPIALGFVAYLLWRAPGQVRLIRDTVRESLGGLLVVGFLGFALNDSGIAVPGVMLGVVNATLVYLTVRTLPMEVRL